MASILQNMFVRALSEDHVKSLKMVKIRIKKIQSKLLFLKVMSHASLYFGVILYTAVGAKVPP